jgi:peptidyl-prolyl cis-trans isomerase SurA
VRYALIGLLFPVAAFADAALVDRIAATVDLHVITRSAVEARVRPRLAQAKTPSEQQQLRTDALKQLIDEVLIADDAAKLRLTVEDSEVDAALAEVAKQNKLTVDQVLGEVRRQGYSTEEYRELLRAQLLELRWVGIKVAQSGQSAGGAEYAAFMAKQREQFVQALRTAAVIEVRP